MKISCSLIFLLITVLSTAQTGSAFGYIKDKSTGLPLAGAEVELCIAVKRTGPYAHIFTWDSTYLTIDSTITDSAGKYYFSSIKPGRYALTCFYAMLPPPGDYSFLADIKGLGRYDTDSAFIIQLGQQYSHDFSLMVTCPYDKTKDQTFCPRCKKDDMVKPIKWGLVRIDRDGNYADGFDPEKYYMGGCVVDVWCNPTRHCDRCDLEF